MDMKTPHGVVGGEPVSPTNGRVVLGDGREVAGTFRYSGLGDDGIHRWHLEVHLGGAAVVTGLKTDELPAKTSVGLTLL